MDGPSAQVVQKDFNYQGTNLDALLSQALQGTSRILGSKKNLCCSICDQSDELYKAQCGGCKSEKLLCKRDKLTLRHLVQQKIEQKIKVPFDRKA